MHIRTVLDNERKITEFFIDKTDFEFYILPTSAMANLPNQAEELTPFGIRGTAVVQLVTGKRGEKRVSSNNSSSITKKTKQVTVFCQSALDWPAREERMMPTINP